MVVPNFLAAAVGFSFLSLLGSIGAGVRGLLSQEIVQPRWRTATSAILILGLALGWASMTLLGSLVIGRWHFSGLMYISAVSALLSMVLILVYLRQNKARTPAQAAAVETG